MGAPPIPPPAPPQGPAPLRTHPPTHDQSRHRTSQSLATPHFAQQAEPTVPGRGEKPRAPRSSYNPRGPCPGGAEPRGAAPAPRAYLNAVAMPLPFPSLPFPSPGVVPGLERPEASAAGRLPARRGGEGKGKERRWRLPRGCSLATGRRAAASPPPPWAMALPLPLPEAAALLAAFLLLLLLLVRAPGGGVEGSGCVVFAAGGGGLARGVICPGGCTLPEGTRSGAPVPAAQGQGVCFSAAKMGSKVEHFRVEAEILPHATSATSVVLPRTWGDRCQLYFGCA